DGHLWHTIRHASGRWTRDFGDIGTQVSGGPPAFTAVGCAGVHEELQVIGLGSDGQLYHTLRHHDGTWQPQWGPVAEESGGGPGAWTAVACGGIGHDLHVVGLGTDQQLYHTIRFPRSWQDEFGPVAEESSGGPGAWIAVSCAGVGSKLEIA